LTPTGGVCSDSALKLTFELSGTTFWYNIMSRSFFGTADQIGKKTICDFGEQWGLFRSNSGYYGSAELLQDIVFPFLSLADIAGKSCAEIGAGTGRIPLMLVEAGAAHVTAIEPSDAYDVLLENTASVRDKITCLRVSGEHIPKAGFDLTLAIGVIHHIPAPKPVLDAAWRSLKDGGRILIWVYGREGNGLYLSFAETIRLITRRLPTKVNYALAAMIYGPAMLYAFLCSRFKWLPLSDYLANVFLRFGAAQRKLVILDQLNPEWTQYYRRHEVEQLLANSGFSQIQSYHRRNYSWTVTGQKLVTNP
jgi:SAM-dependent methyltransferase